MTNILETVAKLVFLFFFVKFIGVMLIWVAIFGGGYLAMAELSLFEPASELIKTLYNLAGAILLGIQEIASEITKQIMELIR